jgi:hypothetical protein
MTSYFSTQGWIYIFISVIFTLIALTLNVYYAGPGFYIIGYIFYFLIILLSAYNISCLTKGECEVWSWIVTFLSILPMIIIIIFIVFTMSIVGSIKNATSVSTVVEEYY